MRTVTVANARVEWKFPCVSAGLLSVAILSAEHYLPADVMYGGSVDFQVALMKGNWIHEAAYLFMGSLGLFWLVEQRQRTIAWKSALVIFFAALCAWCLLSTCWAQESLVSGRRFAAFTLMMMGAAGTAAYWPRKTIVEFISVSAAIHLTIGLLGEIAAAHFTPWNSDYRFAGTLYWNQQGFCCLFLVMSSLTAMDLDPRRKQIFRLLFLYGFVFLVLTKSRSSLIGIAASLVVYLFLTRSSRFKVGAILGLGLGAVLLFVSGALDPIIAMLSRNGEGADNLTGRVPLWTECLEFIKVHPILGYGYESFWTPRHIDYLSEELHWAVSAAHSGYLEALLSLGAVGLVLHVLVLLLGLCRGAALYRKTCNPIFALASCLCAVYLVVGALEAILAVEPSPASFYFSLLLCTLCFEDRHPQTVGSNMAMTPESLFWMSPSSVRSQGTG